VHISKVKSVNLDKWPVDALQNFQKISKKNYYVLLNFFSECNCQ